MNFKFLIIASIFAVGATTFNGVLGMMEVMVEETEGRRIYATYYVPGSDKCYEWVRDITTGQEWGSMKRLEKVVYKYRLVKVEYGFSLDKNDGMVKLLSLAIHNYLQGE